MTSRPLRWTLRSDGRMDGVENMAVDDALARSTGPDGGVVRFYQWARPTLSFGRNEPSRDRYPDADELREQGIDVVRRPTGGRAVLHHRELTYAVIAPVDAFDSLRRAYHEINAALVNGLRRLGVSAEIASDRDVLPLDAGPCFRTPAEGEITLNGRKLVGSAQARIGRTILQHGSILLDDDQRRIEELRRSAGVVDPSPGVGDPATLSEVLDPLPTMDAMIAALAAGFREALAGGADWRRPPADGSFSPEHLAERRAHYRNPEWTWRR